jgi:hypothetical protein
LFVGVNSSTGLDEYLHLEITRGAGGSFGDCAGFTPVEEVAAAKLADLAVVATDFDSGLGGWNPGTSPEVQTFQIVATVDDDNAAQGLAAAASFTWEVQ